MATLSITIPDATLLRVLKAFGYVDTIPDPKDVTKNIANPVTPAVFGKQMLIDLVTDKVSTYEAAQATQLAQTTAVANVDNQIVIT